MAAIQCKSHDMAKAIMKIIQQFGRLFHWRHSQKEAIIVENWEPSGLPGQMVRSNFVICPKCGIKTYIEPTWKAGERMK